jgi:hypothetical protein
LAGLLTYSIFGHPSHSLRNSGKKYCSKTFGGAYSSGSVQDFHLIPFSVSSPERERTPPKFEAKVSENFKFTAHFVKKNVFIHAFIQKITIFATDIE